MKMPWYSELVNSNRSTTEFMKERFKNARFEIVEQHEIDDTIVRESRFISGDNLLVISKVFIPVENPPVFLERIREANMPLGGIIKENEYNVKRRTLSCNKSSKHYAIEGDVRAEVWETYLG